MPSPIRRRLGPVLLAAGLSVALASCGGGGRGEAEDVLDKAFHRDIHSANVKLDAQLDLDGVQGADQPVRVQARGPFKSNGHKLASYDIDLNIQTGGGGQTVSTGRLSTGNRVFVKFEDTYYELDPAAVARDNRQLARDASRGKGLKSLGIDARKWLHSARLEGDDEVGGVKTRHVSGDVDVGELVRGLNKFASRGSAALGGGSTLTPATLPDRVVRDIERAVQNPDFDVYVAKSDDTVRRASAKIDFKVPGKDRARLGGLKGGSLDLTLELSDINGPQRIEAPRRARPYSELAKSLGGAASLGGLLGGGQSPSPRPRPGGGGSAGPDREAFKRYGECLDKAKSNDTRALQNCAKLLR